MLKNSKFLLLMAVVICCYQHSAFSVTYKLAPGGSLLFTNTLNRPISAYCLINAVSNVVNSISITVLRGSGVFNGTSATQGQILYQSVYNSQYIPLTASTNASARISNLGSYTIQAQCTIG